MVYLVSSSAVLFLFWLLLSGFFTPFLISAGILSAVASVALAHRMTVVDREGHPVHLTWRAIPYWTWLVKEIAKSGWSVA
ncbi:MAG: Na+/H+ antiporter subunit E, partial [Kiloniellales bacterium]